MQNPSEAFVERMQQDVSQRENTKQINELKRTEEGRAYLKRIGAADGDQSKKKDPHASLGGIGGTGLSGIAAPKVVVHGQNKINDRKQWDKETWSKNSYLF